MISVDAANYSDKASDAAEVIHLRQVVKSYQRAAEQLLVLNQISMTVNSGEFVALMGPSGSGKTTLLNLIAGLDTPDSGELIVAGEDLHNMSERQLAQWRSRNIGFVFQFYNLIQVLTALENVALPLALLPMSRAERLKRAKFALEVVGLADRLEHYASQLSGGQEQRVAIARAIVTDPQLLIADEPTGDLDRRSAAEVLNLLKSLNQDHHKTIIMVTHDPHAAEFASRVISLDKGEISL